MPSRSLMPHHRVASGLRDKWVEIERTTVPAGGGFPVQTWTALDGAYMSRRDLRADERFASNQDSAYADTEWHMPYRSDMDPDVYDIPATTRLKYQGRVYDIQAANLMDRRIGIELVTIAKVG